MSKQVLVICRSLFLQLEIRGRRGKKPVLVLRRPLSSDGGRGVEEAGRDAFVRGECAWGGSREHPARPALGSGGRESGSLCAVKLELRLGPPRRVHPSPSDVKCLWRLPRPARACGSLVVRRSPSPASPSRRARSSSAALRLGPACPQQRGLWSLRELRPLGPGELARARILARLGERSSALPRGV